MHSRLERRIAALERHAAPAHEARELAVWLKMTRPHYAAIFEQADEASRAQLWAHYAARFVPRDPERDGVAPWPVFALDGIRPSDRVYWQLHVFSEPVPAAWAEYAYCYAWAPYGAHVADVSGYDSHPVEAARRAASRHVVDVYFYGEGRPDMCGIPTRRLSWATQQLASSWPGAGVQRVPVEPEIIIVRPGEQG